METQPDSTETIQFIDSPECSVVNTGIVQPLITQQPEGKEDAHTAVTVTSDEATTSGRNTQARVYTKYTGIPEKKSTVKKVFLFILYVLLALLLCPLWLIIVPLGCCIFCCCYNFNEKWRIKLFTRQLGGIAS